MADRKRAATFSRSRATALPVTMIGNAGPERAALTERDGRELAVRMLRDHDARECCIDPEYRDGAPQKLPFLSYLAALRQHNSPAVDAGFAAILADFISAGLEGSSADIDVYEKFVDA